jgi:hypothetical protein
MNDEFDDLDRALFALPLEVPPAGLRESILRATVYAPRAAEPAFRQWEVVLIGSLLALAAWLLVVFSGQPRYAVELSADATMVVRAFADTTTLAWLAAGGSVAFWFTIVNPSALRIPLRIGRR